MKIELSPVDYYFYRPQLYSIQFAFEYRNRISTQRLLDALVDLTSKMPIIGARLIKLSEVQLILETGHDIPVREQQLSEALKPKPQEHWLLRWHQLLSFARRWRLLLYVPGKPRTSFSKSSDKSGCRRPLCN